MKRVFTLLCVLTAFIGLAKAQDYFLDINLKNGETITYELPTVEALSFDETQWTSLGYCLYGEDFIASEFKISYGGDMRCEYYVEVQENVVQPGLYRLVNPYHPDVYPFAEYIDYDDTVDHYIEIDATDPDGVFIRYQDSGATMHSVFGRMYVYSHTAWYMTEKGYSFDTCKNNGYCGKLEDGVITFPTKELVSAYPNYTSSYYYANSYNYFKVDLNDKSDAPGKKGSKALATTRATGDAVWCVAIMDSQGSETYFAMSHQPIITYRNVALTMTITDDDYTISELPFSDYVKAYFTTEVPTIDPNKQDPDTGGDTGISSLSAGTALVTGLTAGAHVYVYTADGQMVENVKVTTEGSAQVDLSSLKSGQVYILRTPTATYKIIK